MQLKESLFIFSETVGMIVGAVIGSIAFLVLVITIIVAVCCCMKRTQGRRGQVYGNTTGTTIVTNGGEYESNT